jgi:hypothetical protein
MLDVKSLGRGMDSLLLWMLSTATEYAYRPTDGRRQNGKNAHINSTSSQAPDILFSQVLKKSTARLMMSLVPNIKGTAYWEQFTVHVVYNNDEKGDVDDCTKHKGNCIFWYLVLC